ncbi:RDD family protein [Micromonospora peucetia]|uniref:RDD family protein n=1 Tax=Micromonospora peucetia TaxID=47871 RepID=A0A1C6V483_9ACTN|nr:RDD family protein [Micromonospora peucetia]WSA35329.1 RDD family protein [Micromonospora peucetia]SCL60947.1 RDD family protein [Micromonospora peucetia]
MSIGPGWYVDPADPDTRRYWDGGGWIGAPIPVDATPPEGPPPEEPPDEPAPASPTAPVSAPGIPADGQPLPGQPQPGQPQPGQPLAGQPRPGQPYPWQQPGHGHPQGPPPGWPPGGPPPGWPPGGWPGRPPEPRPHGLPLAGFGARLVARLIDFAIVFALNAVVNGWFVWRLVEEVTPYWREVFRRAMAGDSSTDGLPQPSDQAGGLQIVILLIATALWLAYEVPPMASGGQTFGKRLVGVKVVPMSADQPLGFGRALRRWNTLGLPTLLWYCCGLGLLLQLVDALSPLFDHPLRQALHDKRAQTVVVQLPRGHRTTPGERSTPDKRTTPDDRTPDDRTDPSGDTP